MALQFIFGACGTGKTEYIYRTLLTEAQAHPDKRYLLLVPEQEGLQNQWQLSAHALNRGRGLWNIDVLSFERLAHRVLEQAGAGERELLDDMGKSMVLRSIAQTCRPQLQLYGRQLDKAGFIEQLKSQISELYQYGVSEAQLRQAAEMAEQTGQSYTAAKLYDLALLYERFKAYLSAQGLALQEQLMENLLQYLPDSPIPEGAVIVLDGFTGFTPMQYAVLEELLRRSALVMCSICGDEPGLLFGACRPDELFHMSAEMAGRLRRLAEGLGVELLHPVDLNLYDARSGELREPGALLPRFACAPALDMLSRRVFRSTQTAGSGETQAPEVMAEASGEGEGAEAMRSVRGAEAKLPRQQSAWSLQSQLCLIEAGTQLDELRLLAARIQEAVHVDGLRYRELAVLLSEPESYRDQIYQVFTENHIPFFMDDERSLLNAPYVELIRAALELVEENFSYDSVLRFLRSGFVCENDMVVDIFDNYVRARGLRGFSRFREVWPCEETEAEALRAQLMETLEPFYECMRGQRTVSERCAALFALLGQLRVAEKLETLCAGLQAEGALDRAEEFRQGWEETELLLNRLVLLLGELPMRTAEFRSVLDSGLQEVKLKILPATLDQLIFGDLLRSRFSGIRRFFILGANAERLPADGVRQALLNDRDRRLFSELEIALAPDSAEHARINRYYLYLALTRASERLWISWPTRGRDGKAKKPAAIVSQLCRLFPGLAPERRHPERERVYTLAELRHRTAERLARSAQLPEQLERPDFLAGMRVLLDSEAAEAGEKLLRLAFEQDMQPDLGAALAVLLFGERLQGSVTRLEQYRACAYAHFLRYGLRLSERQEAEIRALDLGTLCHNALEQSFHRLMAGQLSLEELSEEQLSGLVEEMVRQAAADLGKEKLLEEGRSSFILYKTREILKNSLWALGQQQARGDFLIYGLEQAFSLEEPSYRLQGRVDRVDCAEGEDGSLYVRIMDYKSSKRELDLNQVYFGLQLQLMTYLDAVLRNLAEKYPDKKLIPAAVLYYCLDDPILSYVPMRGSEQQSLERLRAMRTDGLVNTDIEAIRHMNREIESAADILPVSIRDGVVDEKRRQVASGRRFEQLRRFVRSRLAETVAEILTGNIQAYPLQLNEQRNACTYCPYHAVCRLDTRAKGFHYRKLPKLKPEEIWEAVERSTEAEENEEVQATAIGEGALSEQAGVPGSVQAETSTANILMKAEDEENAAMD